MPNPRILVIDDEMIKRILEEDGYEVETALSGMEAFEKMKGNPFDIVITDLKMPGINGTYEHSFGFFIDDSLIISEERSHSL
ncbi:MAG: response regulator [Thermodesulfobacteriota bacterium]